MTAVPGSGRAATSKGRGLSVPAAVALTVVVVDPGKALVKGGAVLVGGAALVVEPVLAASWIMTAGMLRGTSARAGRDRQPALPGP